MWVLRQGGGVSARGCKVEGSHETSRSSRGNERDEVRQALQVMRILEGTPIRDTARATRKRVVLF